MHLLAPPCISVHISLHLRAHLSASPRPCNSRSPRSRSPRHEIALTAPTGARALRRSRRTKIGTLLISDNGLEAPSAKAIAKAWAENSTLAYLDVRGNKLDADAVKALKAARGAAAKKNTGTAAVELLVDEDP